MGSCPDKLSAIALRTGMYYVDKNLVLNDNFYVGQMKE